MQVDQRKPKKLYDYHRAETEIDQLWDSTETLW